jgi:hypothetical protein
MRLRLPEYPPHRLDHFGAARKIGGAIIGGPDVGILGEGYVQLSYAIRPRTS